MSAYPSIVEPKIARRASAELRIWSYGDVPFRLEPRVTEIWAYLHPGHRTLTIRIKVGDVVIWRQAARTFKGIRRAMAFATPRYRTNALGTSFVSGDALSVARDALMEALV